MIAHIGMVTTTHIGIMPDTECGDFTIALVVVVTTAHTVQQRA